MVPGALTIVTPCRVASPLRGWVKRGVAVGEGEGDAGGHQGPLPRREDDALAGVEVGARVARVGVGGDGELGVEPPDAHLDHVDRPGNPARLVAEAAWVTQVAVDSARAGSRGNRPVVQGGDDGSGVRPVVTGGGHQAAQSLHTICPRTSLASWLRWCTRKHREQVNSSACRGQHADGQFLVGEVGAGQLEALGRLGLVLVDAAGRILSTRRAFSSSMESSFSSSSVLRGAS